MEVWDKKDPKYIKGYRIVQLENGEEQIVVTYGDGATYNVDYSKEMAEKTIIRPKINKSTVTKSNDLSIYLNTFFIYTTYPNNNISQII